MDLWKRVECDGMMGETIVNMLSTIINVGTVYHSELLDRNGYYDTVR